jgi:hypothetical protein
MPECDIPRKVHEQKVTACYASRQQPTKEILILDNQRTYNKI